MNSELQKLFDALTTLVITANKLLDKVLVKLDEDETPKRK